MQTTPLLGRLRTQLAAELCSHFKPSNEASDLLASFADAGPFLDALIRQELWRDAVSLLAHGLPKRSAVWWAGIVCLQQIDGADDDSDAESSGIERERVAIDAAQRWVRDPTEKHRLAACQAGIAAGNRTPAHWVAMSAFWSTGNMTPDSGVVTSAPPFLYAVAVVSALEFAAARCGRHRGIFYKDSLRRGISLASGGDGS